LNSILLEPFYFNSAGDYVILKNTGITNLRDCRVVQYLMKHMQYEARRDARISSNPKSEIRYHLPIIHSIDV